MYKVQGEVYTFTFEPDQITIHSDFVGVRDVTILKNDDEDFSIFDLGPYIAGDVEMFAKTAKIGASTRNNVYLHVTQNPAGFIRVDIRKQPASSSDPIDSGERLHFIKDFIVKVNPME